MLHLILPNLLKYQQQTVLLLRYHLVRHHILLVFINFKEAELPLGGLIFAVLGLDDPRLLGRNMRSEKLCCKPGVPLLRLRRLDGAVPGRVVFVKNMLKQINELVSEQLNELQKEKDKVKEQSQALIEGQSKTAIQLKEMLSSVQNDVLQIVTEKNCSNISVSLGRLLYW